MNIDDLIFEPVRNSPNGGNELQVAKTSYQGVEILEYTYFPWNPLQGVSMWYVIDLVFPLGYMDSLSEDYYTEEGYGVPKVGTLEEAVLIIDLFHKSQEPKILVK